MLQELNLGLRGAAIGLLLLTAVMLWRDGGKLVAVRMGIALELSSICYVGYFANGFPVAVNWWQAPVLALAEVGPVLFWLFAGVLLDDDFRLRLWHGTLATALAALAVLQFFVLERHSPFCMVIGAVLDGVPVLFALMALRLALINWRGDLIEQRRGLRKLVVFAVVANTVLVWLAKLGTGASLESGTLRLIDALVMCVTVFGISLQLFSLRLNDLFGIDPANRLAQSKISPTDAPPTEPKSLIEPASAQAPLTPALSLGDQRLLQRVQALMEEERVYREPDLSIGTLADRMGLAEYRLRRLINQGLGQRNFNTYINRYRLQDVKAALADPNKSDQSVLNIALDSGFQSLGPFNRAFKAETGQTPSEFRREKLSQMA
jgi:AraC-like DNA-binding protein